MTRGRDPIVYRSVRTLFDVGAVGGLTDGELLDRFEGSRCEVAELAFAVLVERHGPMVLRACRRFLRDEHAAQDAFQATFLVLARKGGSVRRRDTLGPWLHGVACRVAACARAAEARRRRHESAAASLARSSPSESLHDEFGSAIHEEIHRLPERYRWPIVLCCLEGISREQAAIRLGWRVGTVQSRLARGRERLRDRLTRRGIVPAVGTVAAALIDEAEAALVAVPGCLVERTVRYGMGFSAGHAAAGTVPAGVATLITGVFQAMFVQKLKAVATATAAVALVGVGVTWGQEPDAAPTRQRADRERASAPRAERLDDIERKLDRLLDVLDRSSPREDPRMLASGAAIAFERVKAASDEFQRAKKLQGQGYVSEGKVQEARIALMEAEQSLDRAKTRLAGAEKAPSTPKMTIVAPVPPKPVDATEPPMPPVLARLREVEPGRLDRLEHRLGALERRLDALERHPDAAGTMRTIPALPKGN